MKCVFVSKDNLWSNTLFENLSKDVNASWSRVTDNIDLQMLSKSQIKPDWVFFFHWSNIVPERIWKNLRCVTIHTSNLPEGRGGSPIQNQIINCVMSSHVNAIEMSNILDGGPIYCSLPVTLQGSLTDVWLAISHQSKNLIKMCVEENLSPVEQDLSNSSIAKRRKTSQIPMANIEDIIDLYDYVRMLDADGYPKSQFNVGNFSIELSRSSIEGDSILCDARIRVLK